MLRKISVLISGLIALYAFQQGDEIEIQGKRIQNIKSCGGWQVRSQQNRLFTCRSGANCTFFFYNTM